MGVGQCFVSVREPKSYQMAVQSDESAKWKEAMDDEYNSLIVNRTWKLVDLQKNQNTIDNKWVYKVKETTTVEVERFKAILVVRGFTQEYGIDYGETYSLVVQYLGCKGEFKDISV